VIGFPIKSLPDIRVQKAQNNRNVSNGTNFAKCLPSISNGMEIKGV
jgi:hypothetical protein